MRVGTDGLDLSRCPRGAGGRRLLTETLGRRRTCGRRSVMRDGRAGSGLDRGRDRDPDTEWRRRAGWVGHLAGVRSGGEQASRAGMRVEAAEWAGATATRTGGGRRRGTAARRYRLCRRFRRPRGSARSLAEAGCIGPSAGPASGFGLPRPINLAMSDGCGTWYLVLPCSVRAEPPPMTAFHRLCACQVRSPHSCRRQLAWMRNEGPCTRQQPPCSEIRVSEEDLLHARELLSPW